MSVRFSIVIPTHNRLHLLRDAIETVRRQNFEEWEVVVFDNASADPIGEHVSSLKDDRIRYSRSEKFLPVTESWNRAINLARGDYVLLLGDDDGLIPNYFRRVQAIIDKFKKPDVVYNDFYQFWHPGVAPWEPSGYVIDVRHAFFFVGRKEPFLLSREEAARAASGSIRLKINFSFNSQAIIYKREFLDKLRMDGPIFRSPFPDYYIANVALVRSTSTVVIPEPMAISGVAKASFGFTIYNGKDELGAALLNTNLHHDPVYQEVEPRLLPGPSYNTNFVVAMEYVARALPELRRKVDFARYRRIQIFLAMTGALSGEPGGAVWPEVRRRLSFSERAWCSFVWRVLRMSKRYPIVERHVLSRIKRSVSMSDFEPMVRHCGKHNFCRVTDLYDAFLSGALS